jgi:uncharacterized membrane protein
MPTFYCPHCGSVLYPTEVASGECTACLRALPRDLSPGSPARTVRSRSVSARVGLEAVGFGVGLMCWGVILSLFGALTSCGTFGCSVFFQTPDTPDAASLLLPLLPAGGSVLGLLLRFAGICLGCKAPSSSGARLFARMNVGSVGLVFLSFVAAFAVNLAASQQLQGLGVLLGVIALVFVLLALLAALAGYVSHYLYLRQVARCCDDAPLGGRFLFYLVVSTLAAFLFAVTWIVLALAWNLHRIGPIKGEPRLGLVIGVFVMVAYSVVSDLWLLDLLRKLRERIASG